jgi:3-oxoacyl-[acyl-carrier protein] reductase
MPITPDSILLNGRRAVVTGAAQGIGAAVAITLARFGADVAICDRDADGLARTAGGIAAEGRHAHAELLDVRDADAVNAWIAPLDRVDVLVNNAGGGFQAAFIDVNEKGQDALIRENFSSVTHCIRACVPKMPETGGSIVNITSIEAHRAAPGFAVYAAMKAGLVNLTMSLSLELGSRLIRVNCIAPDVIPTPGIGMMEGAPIHTPLPVKGHPDDIAGAALFLASDLGRFVTGTSVLVDGGNLAAAGWVRTPDGGWSTYPV